MPVNLRIPLSLIGYKVYRLSVLLKLDNCGLSRRLRDVNRVVDGVDISSDLNRVCERWSLTMLLIV